MNLVLFDDNDLIGDNRVRLRGHRYNHIATILRKTAGDHIRIGRLNGLIGSGTILSRTDQELTLTVQLDETPPAPLPVTLVLALPRPKVLRRILRTITAMGIKTLYLINSYQVDKSYWGTPLLQPDALEQQLRIGLEQGRDTLLPQVHLCPRFRPFVEDILPAICRTTTNLVAHPGVTTPFPQHPANPATLAIGPEGGFIPYEIDRLGACGFTPVHLGQRILPVEAAISVLVSRFVGI